MHRFPNANSTFASDTAASVIVGITPKRGANSRNRTASSCPQPKIVIPVVGTAEEEADASHRRRAAVPAGSLLLMPPSQGGLVLPARMWILICRRHVHAGEVMVGVGFGGGVG